MTMKRQAALITILIILLPPATASLSNYPDMFFKDSEFNTKIVVGAKAPSQDVASAVEMIPELQARSDERIKGSMLDKDVTDYLLQSQNIISVGKPCDNTVTKEILQVEKCGVFEEGTGYIIIKESPLGQTWMVIAGGTPTDTEKAAMVLASPEDYDLSGNAVKITGGEPPYDIEETTIEEILPGEQVNDTVNKAPQINETEINQTPEVDVGVETEEEPNNSEIDEKSQRLNQKIERLTQEETPNTTQESQEPEEKEENPPGGDTWYEDTWLQFKDWLNWFFQI